MFQEYQNSLYFENVFLKNLYDRFFHLTTSDTVSDMDELRELENSEHQARVLDYESEKDSDDKHDEDDDDDRKHTREFFKRLFCARSKETKEFKLDCSRLKRPRRQSQLHFVLSL